MLFWSEQYSTGSPTIDGQHRELFEHLNRLEGLLVQTNPTSKDISTIIELLDFLEHYLDIHFSYEERCMESYRCPTHEKNKEAHQSFQQMFHQFKAQIKKRGYRLEMLIELNQTINSWIEDHILLLDTQLKPCIARHGGLQK
jgi:hemerythrin